MSSDFFGVCYAGTMNCAIYGDVIYCEFEWMHAGEAVDVYYGKCVELNN